MNSIKLKNDNMIVIFVVLLMIDSMSDKPSCFVQTSIILNLILIKKDGIPNIILKYPLLYYF